jgi:hypothetical protein
VFDEKALRRVDWKPGVPVKLGDGQTWELRKPRIRLVPMRVDGRAKARATAPNELGPESDELLGVFFGDIESEQWTFMSARFEMAIRLLEANYTLTDEHYRELLWFERDNPESEEIWDAVSGVIAGRSPKPTPAT